MTAIAAILDKDGTIWMGGDSAGVSGTHTEMRKDRKIFYNGNFIMGFAGSFRVRDLLQYTFKPPEHPKNMSVVEYINRHFITQARRCLSDGSASNHTFYILIGYRKHLFKVESDYQIGMPAANYTAVGCGYELCLGSLHSTATDPSLNSKQRIRMALKAAEAFSGGVTGPFTIKSLKV